MSKYLFPDNLSTCDISDYDQLILAIYQGPTEDQPWSHFLHMVSEKLPGAIASIIFRAPSQGDRGFIRHIDDGNEWAKHYDGYFSEKDPFVGLPEAEVLSIWDFVGENALLTSEYYTGFMVPLSVVDVIGFDIHGGEGISISFRLCLMSESDQRFSTSIKDLLHLLSGHLLMAASLHMELLKGQSMLAFMQQHLESLDVAALAIEDNGSILTANQASVPFMKQAQCFSPSTEVLKFCQPSQQEDFQLLINHCVNQYRDHGVCDSTGMLVKNGSQMPITVILKPIPASLEESYKRPAVFVMLYNPQRELVINHKLLQEIYGLTTTECNFLDFVMQGEDIKEAAHLLNITVNTARSHMKSIYAKTGINRQIDLINLVWRTII